LGATEKQSVSLGRALLRASAGSVAALTQVTVAEEVVAAPLLLNDGARQAWTLPNGTYEVEVTVKPEMNVRDGVIVSWPGSNVGTVAERQSHRLRGRVVETSALTIENPTVLGMGAKVDGFVRVLRVPD
jgi:hypothetical protein